MILAEMSGPVLAANVLKSMIYFIYTLRQDILNKNANSLFENLQSEVVNNKISVDSLLYIINDQEVQIVNSKLAENAVEKIKERM